jgi:hypothetical protein
LDDRQLRTSVTTHPYADHHNDGSSNDDSCGYYDHNPTANYHYNDNN